MWSLITVNNGAMAKDLSLDPYKFMTTFGMKTFLYLLSFWDFSTDAANRGTFFSIANHFLIRFKKGRFSIRLFFCFTTEGIGSNDSVDSINVIYCQLVPSKFHQVNQWLSSYFC